MRDEQDAEAGRRVRAVDALGDDLERVDVEPRVGLVEHREARLEEFELHNLVTLLLAPREALVDVARRERRVHLEVGHRLLEGRAPGADRGGFAVDRRLRGAQEVRDRHAGDLDGVLHREEEPGTGALVDAHRQHVLAVELDGAAVDVVPGVTGDRVRERRLARAVGAHDGVDLAVGDRQVDALEDGLRAGLGLDRDVQVSDGQSAHEIFSPM